MHGLVDTCRGVSTNETKDRVEQDHDGAERPTVRGRKEAEECEDDGAAGHNEKLSTVSKQDRQEQRPGWRAEDIAVNQLPARVLLNTVLLKGGCSAEIIQVDLVEAVVPCDVPLQRAHEDGHDGQDQNDDNDGSVYQPEPVDLRVEDVQVLVPSCSPRGRRLAPVNAVAELDLLGRTFLSKNDRAVIITAVRFAVVFLRAGLDNDTHNTKLVRVLVYCMVLDPDLVVVVEHNVVRLIVLAHQEARAVECRPRQLILNLLSGR